MKDGVCPKCGSRKVYSGAHVSDIFRGADNAIPISRGAIFLKRAFLDNYVCVDCGYVESYISDKSALEAIERMWPLVDEKHEDV